MSILQWQCCLLLKPHVNTQACNTVFWRFAVYHALYLETLTSQEMVSKIADLIKLQRFLIQEVFVQGPSSIHILLTDEVRWICVYVLFEIERKREITLSSIPFRLLVHFFGFLLELVPFYIVELVPFGTVSSGCQTSCSEVMGLSPRAIPCDKIKIHKTTSYLYKRKKGKC